MPWSSERSNPAAKYAPTNPAANPAVGDNGFPGDPFGGDAVPGGTSTSPGTRGNGPINGDGFYLVNGLLFSDTTPIAYPGVLLRRHASFSSSSKIVTGASESMVRSITRQLPVGDPGALAAYGFDDALVFVHGGGHVR